MGGKNGKENGQFYCRAKNQNTQALVPAAIGIEGSKKFCKSVCVNGKQHPHDLPKGSSLIPTEICNLSMQNGQCPRKLTKIPSGMRVR